MRRRSRRWREGTRGGHGGGVISPPDKRPPKHPRRFCKIFRLLHPCCHLRQLLLPRRHPILPTLLSTLNSILRMVNSLTRQCFHPFPVGEAVFLIVNEVGLRSRLVRTVRLRGSGGTTMRSETRRWGVLDGQGGLTLQDCVAGNRETKWVRLMVLLSRRGGWGTSLFSSSAPPPPVPPPSVASPTLPPQAPTPSFLNELRMAREQLLSATLERRGVLPSRQ